MCFLSGRPMSWASTLSSLVSIGGERERERERERESLFYISPDYIWSRHQSIKCLCAWWPLIISHQPVASHVEMKMLYIFYVSVTIVTFDFILGGDSFKYSISLSTFVAIGLAEVIKRVCDSIACGFLSQVNIPSALVVTGLVEVKI